MPQAITGHSPALVLLGPGPWARRLTADLAAALPGARTRSCAAVVELPALVAEQDVAAVVARLSADTQTLELAALAKRPGMPPLVVCVGTDAHADALLDIMSSGAAGLVRDGDALGLARALCRACAGADAPTGAGPAVAVEDSEALKALADRVDQPLALVAEGRVWHLNRALHQLLGFATDTDPVGRAFTELAAPDAAKPLATLLARARLLDLDDKTREVLRFVPSAGPAFAAEVTAAPISIAGAPGLAVQLSATGTRAGLGTDPGTVEPPARGNERPALLQRLAVLTDDAGAVERTSALATVSLADYASLRRRLGFAGMSRLVESVAERLVAAAPAEGTLFLVADDTCAVLVEDMGAPEPDRLRRRLGKALAEAADSTLRDLRLHVGVTRVAPGAGTPLELLDRAVADAMPADPETMVSPETTEALDLVETGYSVDTLPPSSIISTRPTSTTAGTKDSQRGGADDDAGLTTPPRLSPSAVRGELGRSAGERVLLDGLMERIERALEGEGFTLALQPIVSLMGDSREHYSVLVRLRRPDGGLATAAQIIRSAAGSGRMADIDRWVLRTALRLLNRHRRAAEKAAFFLSLSPELLADEELLIWICDALREFDVRGSWLTFQLQERHALTERTRWSELVVGLREIRCRVCVNDSGLLSASDGDALGKPDFVKFAPTLASGLSGDRDKQRRLLDLIGRTKARGIRAIVTGVEDSRALNLLWDAGIEYVQGNYLQEPVTSLDLPRQGTAVAGASGPGY